MNWVDTHAHFPSDPRTAAQWVERARAAGVHAMLAVGGSPELNRCALAAAAAHPGGIACALGLDRDQADQPPAPEWGFPPSVTGVAIGEIGLDYHYAKHPATAQRDLFTRQLIVAAQRGLPAIVHSREADVDTLAAIDEAAKAAPPPARGAGVLHCFTGDWPFAVKVLDRGYWISFSGILTFRNAETLRAVASKLPAERLLIETDSPFLAPVPERGNPNEPARLPHIAQLLATLRGMDPAALAATLLCNTRQLFNWPNLPCQ